MKTTTMTGYLSEVFDDKKAIQMIAEAGFDTYDYSLHSCPEDSPVYGDNYREYAMELVETSRSNNIICTQAHAVFPSAKYGEDDFNKTQFEKIVRNIEFAALLGAKSIVIHPIKYPEYVDSKKVNIDFYNRLLPYAKKFNIKIALENMFSIDPKRNYNIASVCGYAEDFRSYLDELDDEHFVGCLDLGHCALVGEEPQDAIRTLGKKYLKAVHVHENNYCWDMHTLPYLGKIEWENVCKAFAEIDYEGEFTFEADNFMKGFPDEFLFEALLFMYKTGRYLADKIEKYKTNL